MVFGNLGENFYLRPDSLQPVKLYVYDFDQNGLAEKVLSRTVEGKEVPIFMKREMTDQIPSLKKQNLKHQDYAKKTVQELFGKNLKKATVQQVNEASSCIAYNDGKGKFAIKKLPIGVQMSSVHAIQSADINKDGYPDLIVGGNFFDLLPQFCRLDASFGHVLMNDKKGGFTEMPMSKSGINVPGQTRDILLFNFQEKQHALFLVNNQTPVLYKLSQVKVN